MHGLLSGRSNGRMNVTRIAKILEGSEAKVIGEKRCFLVSLDEFQEIYNAAPGNQYTDDELTRLHGLENIQLRLSTLEKGDYYVATKSEPILDHLWAKKFKS
jgi:hypothetical protein